MLFTINQTKLYSHRQFFFLYYSKKKKGDVKENESRNCLAKQRGVRVLEVRDEKTVI